MCVEAVRICSQAKDRKRGQSKEPEAGMREPIIATLVADKNASKQAKYYKTYRNL